MVIPTYTAESAIAGTGLFVGQAVAAGQGIFPIDDGQLITSERPLRPEAGEWEYHCDMIAGGQVVLLTGPERFINHCCDPNAYCRIIDGRRWVVARRAIHAGQEITTDYCVNSAIPDFTWDCHCGAARCRRVGACDFFLLPRHFQEEYLPLLDTWFIDENRSRLAVLGLIRR